MEDIINGSLLWLDTIANTVSEPKLLLANGMLLVIVLFLMAMVAFDRD